MCPYGGSSRATSTPISPSGNRRSNGAASRSRAVVRSRTCSSTSPPPTPGPATTRRPRKPQPNCRRSIPASRCRPGQESTGPTIRPSTRNISASSRACARRARRRVRRRQIERTAHVNARLPRPQSVSSRERSSLAQREYPLPAGCLLSNRGPGRTGIRPRRRPSSGPAKSARRRLKSSCRFGRHAGSAHRRHFIASANRTHYTKRALIDPSAAKSGRISCRAYPGLLASAMVGRHGAHQFQ
jgi:hypothetical protein